MVFRKPILKCLNILKVDKSSQFSLSVKTTPIPSKTASHRNSYDACKSKFASLEKRKAITFIRNTPPFRGGTYGRGPGWV